MGGKAQGEARGVVMHARPPQEAPSACTLIPLLCSLCSQVLQEIGESKCMLVFSFFYFWEKINLVHCLQMGNKIMALMSLRCDREGGCLHVKGCFPLSCCINRLQARGPAE